MKRFPLLLPLLLASSLALCAEPPVPKDAPPSPPAVKATVPVTKFLLPNNVETDSEQVFAILKQQDEIIRQKDAELKECYRRIGLLIDLLAAPKPSPVTKP